MSQYVDHKNTTNNLNKNEMKREQRSRKYSNRCDVGGGSGSHGFIEGSLIGGEVLVPLGMTRESLGVINRP